MNAEQRSAIDEQMESIGFVTTDVACGIVGRTRGGNFPEFMQKRGVRMLESVNGAKRFRFYNREDCERIAANRDEPNGEFRTQLADFERRIKKLEELLLS